MKDDGKEKKPRGAVLTYCAPMGFLVFQSISLKHEVYLAKIEVMCYTLTYES